MELFLKLKIIISKSSILDVWLSSEYVSVLNYRAWAKTIPEAYINFSLKSI